jgi:hypothetical protein
VSKKNPDLATICRVVYSLFIDKTFYNHYIENINAMIIEVRNG